MNFKNTKLVLKLKRMLSEHLQNKDCRYHGPYTDGCHNSQHLDSWLFCEWGDRLYETIKELEAKNEF